MITFVETNLFVGLCTSVERSLTSPQWCCSQIRPASPKRNFQQPQQAFWAEANRYITSVHCQQQQFVVNVWARVVNDFLIGPYSLSWWLCAQIYHVFLEEKLSEMLEKILLSIRRNMWFQDNRAAAHIAHQVWQHHTTNYNNYWTGQGQPMAWPPKSPDLIPMDFFIWGHIKNLIYMSRVDCEEALIAHIVEAARTIRQEHGIFERTC
jgi:hypothetical protein